MVRYVVEDEVVALIVLSEVLAGVVDDVIGADRSDHAHVSGAAHAGHLGAESLRDLHREGADAPGGAADQDLLPGSNIAVIAKGLKADEPGHGNGRGLFEGEVGRLRRQCVFGDGRVLGTGTTEPTAPAEDLLSGLKA